MTLTFLVTSTFNPRSSGINKNYSRMFIHYSTKYEVNPTDGLEGDQEIDRMEHAAPGKLSEHALPHENPDGQKKMKPIYLPQHG